MNKLDKIHKELDFYTQTVLALELTSLRVARAQLKIDTVKYSIAGAVIGLFGRVGEFLLASRMDDSSPLKNNFYCAGHPKMFL